MFDPYVRTRAAAAANTGGRDTRYARVSRLESDACCSREAPSDPPQRKPSTGLGNRKNKLVLELIREHGVQSHEGAVRYLRVALGAGLRCAIISSSTNARDLLMAAGLDELFEVVIGGAPPSERISLANPSPTPAWPVLEPSLFNLGTGGRV